MLIEEPEVLKQWLTTHLEPLCDAEPAALAKYVLALIKKEKTKDELKESMVQQMDVFLQSETNSFIEMLFKVVESKEYLDSGNVEKAVIDAKAGQLSQAKAELEAVEAKIEAAADSTTPQREEKYVTEERSRKIRAGSPGQSRRLASRLGPRETSRRFRSRSRSRSLSPRYERVRSRRRSRSPPPGYIDRGDRRRMEFILRRGRSLERARYKVTSRDSTPTRDEGYTPTAIVKRKGPRCRDYELKGFCLKGDLCYLDHGPDAMVLEDAAKAVTAPAYQPTDPYVPGLPRVTAGIPYPPPATAISVPPPGFPPGIVGKRSFDGSGYEPPTKMGRGRGRGGRGGRGGGRGGLGSSMLAVRNIPAPFNTITHLNGHFSRYGALQNVQVQFEGDPSSALITFHSTEEASMAFNSSEAVMNNRFIKMFWHSDRGNVKNRLGGGGGFGPGKFSKTISNDINQEEMDPEKVKEMKDKEKIAVKKNQEMLQAKNELLKKAAEKRKAAMAQQGGILKSKRDLLDGLIEQQKALIVKIEKGKGTMKQEEKTKVMSLLKELSNSIDKTKEDIKNMISISGLKKRSKAEVQKELLDAEMELFTAQHDGGPELEQIQQKVNSLNIEAARAGILPTSKAPRGRGKMSRGRGRGGVTSIRGRGRGGARGGRGGGVAELGGANRLDRRPGSVMVTGYPEAMDREELVGHFRKFGEIVEVIDQEDSSIVVKFKQIRSAQTAINTGKTFGESTLGVSWFSTETSQAGEMPTTEASNEEEDGETPYQEDYLPAGLHEAEAGNGDEAETTVEINEKLLDDEEEEGVEEERSWKRRANDED